MFGIADAFREEMAAMTSVTTVTLEDASAAPVVVYAEYSCDYCGTLFTIKDSCGCGANRHTPKRGVFYVDVGNMPQLPRMRR